MRDRERHREVGHPDAGLLGERDDLLHGVDPPLVLVVPEHGRASEIGLLSPPEPSGQHAAGERTPDEGAHAVALRDGQHFPFDATVQDRVGRLLGAEALEAPTLGGPLRLDLHRGGEVRAADRSHLAAADQIGQRGERLLEVDGVVRTVRLVQVDVVGPQPTERVLDGAHDPSAGVAAPVRVGAHRSVELRGQDHVVATAGERLADELFGAALRVSVGRVDDVDARIDGSMHDADGVPLVAVPDAAVRAEHHGPEGERAHLDPGPAEGAVVHVVFLPSMALCCPVPYR